MNYFITEINITYAKALALYKYAHAIHKALVFSHRNTPLVTVIIVYQYSHILDVDGVS